MSRKIKDAIAFIFIYLVLRDAPCTESGHHGHSGRCGDGVDRAFGLRQIHFSENPEPDE